MRNRMARGGTAPFVGFVATCAFAVGALDVAVAQQAQRPQPPPTAQARPATELTGTWVSVVTEDWRWRMVTPEKGDYASVPINSEGRKVADTWDLTRDVAQGNQCRPFGVGVANSRISSPSASP